MNYDTDKYKIYTWKSGVMLHWILNPGLAFNELFLGQRVPKVSLIDKTSDKPYMDRGFTPCPHCRLPAPVADVVCPEQPGLRQLVRPVLLQMRRHHSLSAQRHEFHPARRHGAAVVVVSGCAQNRLAETPTGPVRQPRPEQPDICQNELAGYRRGVWRIHVFVLHTL